MDILLSLFHHAAIGFPGEQRGKFALKNQRIFRCRISVLNQCLHPAYFQTCPVIIFFRVIQSYIDNQLNFLLQVIKHNDLIKKHEIQIGNAFIIFRRKMQ